MFTRHSSFLLTALIVVAWLSSACSSMLPRGSDKVVSPWKSFDQAMQAYDRIVPYETRQEQLTDLGFAPGSNRNVRILSHLDVLHRFLPNKALTPDNLPNGMRECIAIGEACRGYEVNQLVSRSRRNGNFFADFLNFNRQTETTGWEFNAVIVMNHDLVVYKLWSGKPDIHYIKESRNPLGPLQGSGPDLIKPDI